MKSSSPLILLRGKLGCSVVCMQKSGAPKVLAWIPAEQVEALLSASKIPRPKDDEITFDAFRDELLK